MHFDMRDKRVPKKRNDSPYVITFSGKKLCLGNLDPSLILKEDMLHSAAGLARFNGHLRESVHPYTVLQHAANVAKVVQYLGGTPQDELQGLYHDAAEYILGDVITPVKKHISAVTGTPFSKVEGYVEKIVLGKFGVNYPLHPIVKLADTMCFLKEALTLHPHGDLFVVSDAVYLAVDNLPEGVVDLWPKSRAEVVTDWVKLELDVRGRIEGSIRRRA